MNFPPAPQTDPSGCFALIPEPERDRIRIARIAPPSGEHIDHRVCGLRPGAGPIQLLFHPELPVIFVANAGNSTVAACHWDCAAGHASFAQAIGTVPPMFTPANTVTGIALAPSGRYLYAANRGHDSVSLFAIQRGKGKLFVRMREMLPAAPSGPPMLDASGTLLTLPGPAGPMRFAIQPANGTLTRA